MEAGRIARFLARHRGNPLLERGALLAGRYLAGYGNLDYDSRTNGEERVLRVLGQSAVGRVFDVGANVGDWTALAVEAVPGAEVHAFEVVPELAARMTQRFGGVEHVSVNPFGLGDRTGEVQVHYFPDAPLLSSLHDLPHAVSSEVRRSSTTTGDEYCERHRIETIDLLKIDVEGHELAVVRGFEQMLRANTIRAVQFEYGWASIYTKVLLHDFHTHLGARGYVIGKIFPRTVVFRDYTVLDEDFLGPNYIAVHNEDKELRAALT